MAHFIKLTDGTGADPVRYVNIAHIVDFFPTTSGSTVSTSLVDTDSGSSGIRVQETPDQILALIAEAQGAK